MLRITQLICLMAISVFTTAQTKLVEKVTKKSDEIVIPFEKYVLSNGLTVVVHEDHSDPLVHVDVTYHVGSGREEIGKSGFAHFFEHMMFQGSDNIADEQHFKIISDAGGTLNGSTNKDRTNYYQTVPSNQLEKVLWMEADRMGFFLDAVTQQKFEIQRSTVKNERGQNYDNRPYGLLGEVTAKNLYPYGHPYSWLTIGYLEDLDRSSVDDLKNFFLRWYGPNNATLTVGGNVKAADVVRLAEKYFGSIPRGPEVSSVKLPAVQLTTNRYASYVDNYARIPQLRIVYPTVPDYHEDMAALACLAQVLGSGKNSVLYQQLVKPQKALSASAFSSLSELAGEFIFSITPYPGNTLTDMEKLVDQALLDFEKRGILQDDVDKFKSQNESRTINRLASVSGKVSQLAAFQTYQGTPNKIGELLDMYNKVTREDVMRVYNKYIKGKNRLVVSAVPKGKEDQKAAPDNYAVDPAGYKSPDYGYAGLKYTKPKDNFDRTVMPAAGPNPVVSVPKLWTGKLKNGFAYIGTKNDELPVVNLSIYLKGGRLPEAKDLSKAGLSNMFASMMNEDTKNYSAEEFDLELETLGSSIRVDNSTDATVISVSSLTKNLDKTIKLLEERIMNPVFREESFNRIRKQLLENIKNSRTSASTVASNVYAALNYGQGNLFGLPANGTTETINNLTLDDVKNYYRDYISSDGGRVVVVGDVDEKFILPKLAFLDKLPDHKVTLPEVKTALQPAKTKIYLVDIPKAAQTEFRVGHVVPLRYDATGDYYKSTLANYNLGASFNSRLNINLREDKGWTYGARSNFNADKYTGEFTFSSGIKATATDSALTEVLNEITGYLKNGIKPDEITFMRNSIGQADARAYETGSQKAAFLNRIAQYGLEHDYVKKQMGILNSMSKADIDKIATKYIDPSKLNIVLVGDKELIKPGLSKLGYEIVELTVDGVPVR